MVQQQLCVWGVRNNQTRCSVCPTLHTPVRTKWPVHKSKYLVFSYLTLKLEVLFCFGLNSLYTFEASIISYATATFLWGVIEKVLWFWQEHFCDFQFLLWLLWFQKPLHPHPHLPHLFVCLSVKRHLLILLCSISNDNKLNTATQGTCCAYAY